MAAVLSFLFTFFGLLYFNKTVNAKNAYHVERYNRLRHGLSEALMQLNNVNLKLLSHHNRIKQLVERNQRLRQSNAQLHRDFGRALYQKGIKKGKSDAKKEKTRS